MAESERESQPGQRIFATTHWSVVLAAGTDDPAPAQRALETLCQAYWYPIYVYVRRKGHGDDDAQDLTQEFFAQLIAKDLVRRADRQKGRFRNFLLGMLDYFLAREWDRAHRQKRGGKFLFISLDERTPEERYRLEPAETSTPETSFVRQWALTVLENAMVSLETECRDAGKDQFFAEVKAILSEDPPDGTYAAMAKRLGMSEGAIRVAVHRLRRRYGDLLREEIAQTVETPDDIEAELRHLMAALRL